MHRKFVDLAIEQAKKSPCNIKHGSVIVKNKKVLSKGYNKYIYTCYSFESGKITVHSEADCISKCINTNGRRSLKGATIYIIRLNYLNELKMSCPCENCYSLIIKYGIKTVYYSTNETNELQVIKREKIK